MEYLKNMVDEGLLRVTFPLILWYWASYETGKEKSYLIKVTSYQCYHWVISKQMNV